MLPTSRLNIQNDPRRQRIFLIRHLNDSTKSCLKLSSHPAFRSTYTISPFLDQTSQDAADKLAEDVYRNKKDFLENITVLGLVALVSTNTDLYFKTPIVNLAIKWLLFNPVPDETLHSVLMSLNIYYIPLPKMAQVRVAIYLYLKTPELYTYYDINFAPPGIVFIRRKSGIPNDPEEYNDQEKKWIYESINSVTDKYVNPTWPDGTRRKNSDGLLPNSGKLNLAKELENPLFKWDFDNKGTEYVHKEPVVPDPLTAPRPIEFAVVPPRRGFVASSVRYNFEMKKVEAQRNFPPRPKPPAPLVPLLPPGAKNETVRKLASVQTSSSGYHSAYSTETKRTSYYRPTKIPDQEFAKKLSISTPINNVVKTSTPAKKTWFNVSTTNPTKPIDNRSYSTTRASSGQIRMRPNHGEKIIPVTHRPAGSPVGSPVKIPTKTENKEPEIPPKIVQKPSIPYQQKQQISSSSRKEPKDIPMEKWDQHRNEIIEKKKINEKMRPKFFFDQARNVLEMI